MTEEPEVRIVPIFDCPICHAAVFDEYRHARWHRTMTNLED